MALQRWPLAKYSHWSTADEAWIEHPAKDMCIQITQMKYVQIVDDDTLLECLALADLRQWVAVRRHTNVLFKLAADGRVRKFRVRFAQPPDEALHFLAEFVRVQDADQPPASSLDARPVSTTTTPCVGLAQLTRQLLQSRALACSGSWKNDASDAQRLTDAVRWCLLDASFPALVEGVEAALRTLAASPRGGVDSDSSDAETAP